MPSRLARPVTIHRNRAGRYSLSLARAFADLLDLQGGERATWREAGKVEGRRALLLVLEEPEKGPE